MNNKRRFRGFFLTGLMMFVGYLAYADTVTVSTYYPSPYGSYQNLDTAGETHLATGGSGVSIGKTTAPSSQLDIKGAGTGETLIGQLPSDTTFSALGLANSLAAGSYNLASSPGNTNLFINRPTGRSILFRENNTDQMILMNGGYVGIGTTTPTTNNAFSRLTVSANDPTANALGIENPGNGQVGLILHRLGAVPIRWYLYSPAASTDLRFYNGADVLTIQNSGNVGIGTATPAEKLTVVGNVQATAFFYSSDARLKTDIHPVKGMDIINGLNGVSYKWKDSGRSSGGLLAQDVEKVFPEAVATNPATDMKSVDYGALTGPMVEAIKELENEVKQLRKELDGLKVK